MGPTREAVPAKRRRLLRWGWAGLAFFCASTGCSHAPAPAPDARIECSFDPSPPTVGPLGIDLTIADAAGEPLVGAKVRLEGNMNHPGMVPAVAQAAEVSPGRYRASIELGMAGDWFLLVEAELADGRKIERTMDLPNVLKR